MVDSLDRWSYRLGLLIGSFEDDSITSAELSFCLLLVRRINDVCSVRLIFRFTGRCC